MGFNFIQLLKYVFCTVKFLFHHLDLAVIWSLLTSLRFDIFKEVLRLAAPPPVFLSEAKHLTRHPPSVFFGDPILRKLFSIQWIPVFSFLETGMTGEAFFITGTKKANLNEIRFMSQNIKPDFASTMT